MKIPFFLYAICILLGTNCAYAKKSSTEIEYSLRKTGDGIIISPCANCPAIPVRDFKSQFLAAMQIPGTYIPELIQKIKAPQKKVPVDIRDIRRSIARAEHFVMRFGSSPKSKALLEQIHKTMIPQLLNDLFAQLVDDIFNQPLLKSITVSPSVNSFDWNILQSYVEKKTFNANYRLIPSGSVTIGTSEVTMTKAFEIQTTVVSQKQFFEVMGYNPSYLTSQDSCPNGVTESIHSVEICPANPVERISLDDAFRFIKRLNELDPVYNYRLPSEGEWELPAQKYPMHNELWQWTLDWKDYSESAQIRNARSTGFLNIGFRLVRYKK
ncbi:SUMF1/EgtB/PvdO family nonheme iron enzyme [Bdellovibrio sp. HCB-110]|uniref:SUMF1/EgtB/PvdO family nonheme iron enzyme n=1 Tax=Bdellovibrio sp. HCB-110 TaxID=3391182 RepID=UPI0039B4C4C4